MKYENLKKVWIITLISLFIVTGVTIGIAKSQAKFDPPIHPNEAVFAKYPSDGTAFNEIHRYYGSCDVFGEVAAACYDGGYALKPKNQVYQKIEKKHWIMSQGQIDMCNMMFNKGTYDQYMGEDMKSLTLMMDNVGGYCDKSLKDINAKEFNETYGAKK